MANVALKSFMGASALVGSALALAAHAEPVAQVRYHTVFFKEARQRQAVGKFTYKIFCEPECA